jgi:uncharacterized protein (TIGR03083 family)
MAEPLAELMEQAWSSMEEVCAQLSPEEWALATDCPGWTVKDQLAHIVAIESLLLGRPPAPGGPLRAPHVRNDIGAVNEREIEARRSRSPEELLAEYREVTAERARALAAWDDWDAEDLGPLGRAPRREIVAKRIVDVFTHEQDVRVATGRPGHLNGEVARLVLGRMRDAMGYVLARRARAAEGETAVFEVGPPGEAFAVAMRDGRGVLVETPTEPAVRLAMDAEAFLRLTAGRWTPGPLEAEGRLRVAGDRGLADRILAGINIMP